MQYSFHGKPNDFSEETIAQSFFKTENIIRPVQTHSKKIVEITPDNITEIIDADGVWTREKDITLSVQTADCCGILFYHPEENIVAAVHAGWRGLAQKISTEFLQQFTPQTRKGFQVFLSPSLGKCCSEFSDPYHETPDFFHECITKTEGKFFVDLVQVLENELCAMDISKENIMRSGVCTKCSPHWWSYRDGDRCARNISAISLS